MTASARILDLILLAVLTAFALRGASRGLILTLCGLGAMLVSFLGAGFVAGLLAPQVADALEPRFAAAIEERLEDHLEAALPGGEALDTGNIPLSDLLEILRDMGLYQSAVDAVERAVDQGMTETAAGVAAAVAASIAERVAYMLLFVVSSAVILVLWTILSHTLNLVARLPGLHTLNRTGGAILGLLKGCAVLFLCAWVLRYLGSVIPEETVEQTHLLKFFLNTNPLTLIFDGIAFSASLSI
ncbi:CvpA family protein [uncultured Intestinimonas sp.]|uniref:CvpA family protein n=1 Tax=uncultured Intestinimonas sp. TaxID=1689265 RepID=UPI0025FB1887|nr:CvpA family protein [uncultured Intestinimonas sp.]